MEDSTISMPLVAKGDSMNAIIKSSNVIDNSTAVGFQKNPIILTTNSTPTNVNSIANTQQQSTAATESTTTAATALLSVQHHQLLQQHNHNQQQHNQLPLQPSNFVGNNLKNGTLSYG